MLYIAMVLFVLVSVGLAVLAVENFSSDVTLALVAWQTHMPLGLLLLLAFALGAAMLYIVSAASAWQDSSELKRLRLRIAELERAAANVPTAALPGAAPIVPMPGMPPTPTTDISDMTTQH